MSGAMPEGGVSIAVALQVSYGRQDFGLRRELSRTLELRHSAKLSRAVETLPALRKSLNLHHINGQG
jgi:hypothetical protein